MLRQVARRLSSRVKQPPAALRLAWPRSSWNADAPYTSYAQRSLLRKVPPHVARWNPAASGTLAGKNFETAPSSVYTPPAEQQTTKPKLPKASFPMRARARRAEQDPLAWRYPAAYNDKDKQRPFESPEAPDWYRP